MRTTVPRLTRRRRASQLKLILVSRSISQRRLASDLRLNYLLVHRLVNGELLPGPKVADRIAKYLGSSPEVLFNLDDRDD